MNHFREIAYLTNIGKPDIAVIVNIGTMHIEHLGSVEGILKAKMEIVEGLQENGLLLLNGDDPMLWTQREHGVKPQFFGSSNGLCQVCAADVQQSEGLLRFWVRSKERAFPVVLPLEGMHYVPDSLAAVSVGLALGVSSSAIQESLGNFRNMAGRQEIFEANGYTIIKDCYNAGPESMAAALEVLGNRPGRHVAVLGDMLELGAAAQAEHYKVGRIAAEKVQILLAYGPNSQKVLSGAVTGGMPQTHAKAFLDRDKLTNLLKQLVKPGDVILFKGSRGMRMELILEAFLQKEE